MAVPDRVRSTMRRLGLRGVNKPKRTPRHKTKSHVVMAKSGSRYKLIRFGQQGAKTAGKPRKGESARTKAKLRPIILDQFSNERQRIFVSPPGKCNRYSGKGEALNV